MLIWSIDEAILMEPMCAGQYGYEEKDITTLVDSEEVPHEFWPTKQNIVSGLGLCDESPVVDNERDAAQCDGRSHCGQAGWGPHRVLM